MKKKTSKRTLLWTRPGSKLSYKIYTSHDESRKEIVENRINYAVFELIVFFPNSIMNGKPGVKYYVYVS